MRYAAPGGKRMRQFVIYCVMLVCIPAAAFAQSASESKADRDAILATVQKFFDTMASRDVEAARSLLIPEGRMFAVVDGKTPVTFRSRALQEHLDSMGTRKEHFRERFWNPEVRIQGPIAVVWTPYDFWIDGKFSHCGVDAFDLVKTPEGWKISGGVYTVQRDGCPPSPLGPLK